MKSPSFGEYILSKREEQSLSQRQLANLAEVTNSTISRIEADLVTPDLNTIEKISNALNIDKSTLLNESGYLDIPEDFLLIARKTGELSVEKRAEVFRTLNNTVDIFLKSLEDNEGNDD